MSIVQKTMGLIAVIGCAAVVAQAAGPQNYQLGPTGLQGTISKATIKVSAVAKGSPSDGKIKKGDEIIGVGAAKFKSDPRRELADAVDAAETADAGGKLSLTLKGNKKVELQLAVLGSYSATAPYNCPKSEKIITMAADAILKNGLGKGSRLHPELLGLMATGDKKYIDAVAKSIQGAEWAKPDQAKVDAVLAGEADAGYATWSWGYDLITLSEYYLLTGDQSVLPAIKTYAVAIAKGQDAGGMYGHRFTSPKRFNRLPGYGQMNQPSLTCFMGMLLAAKCGITDPALTQGIQKTYAYVNTHVGKGAFPYGVHGPNSGTWNNNGTSGSAAICMSLLNKPEAAKFFSQITAPSYEGLESGHASTFFNPLWTPLGANLSGPEVTQEFFRKSRWLQTSYRGWDGNFSRFGGNSKEGPQAGTALLTYCLPRKVLFITGRKADESIWVKGKDAADVVMASKIDYKSKSVEDLMSMAVNHFLPQVRRGASAALGQHRENLTPTWIKYLKEGTPEQKELAIAQYGWWIPIEQRLPRLDDIGALLRDASQPLDVRVAAVGSLAYMGETAQKYYPDMVKLLALDKPGDPFGLTDSGIGRSVNVLCKTPFASGLVPDKATHYKAALKLVKNKRQNARTEGLRMLAEVPLEDFPLVADDVLHIVKDQDSTYHSYHNPGGPVAAAVTILANLNVEEGIDMALQIVNNPSGKGSFKMRALMDSLSKYGANAKPALEKLKADEKWKTVPENRKLRGSWNNMVKAIEADKNPQKLITLAEAKKGGK